MLPFSFYNDYKLHILYLFWKVAGVAHFSFEMRQLQHILCQLDCVPHNAPLSFEHFQGKKRRPCKHLPYLKRYEHQNILFKKRAIYLFDIKDFMSTTKKAPLPAVWRPIRSFKLLENGIRKLQWKRVEFRRVKLKGELKLYSEWWFCMKTTFRLSFADYLSTLCKHWRAKAMQLLRYSVTYLSTFFSNK